MKIRLIILLLISSLPAFCQMTFNTEEADTSNVYHFALREYCKYLSKTSSSIETIYIESNYLVTNNLPTKIKQLEIQYLSEKEIKKHLKGKAKMTLVNILPLEVKGGDFCVKIIPFKVEYKRGHFNYFNYGGLGVHFKFDKNLNGLVFTYSKMGGI